MTKEKNKQKKIVYIEFIRIFAIYWVIFNHTSEMGFALFASQETDTLSFWLYMFISVFCKVAVPLFFAISGALLLEKEESIGVLWKNRIFKILLILIFFSIADYLNYYFYSGKPINIRNIFLSIYDGPTLVNGHLWYLYAYIAFLICIPFLRILVQNFEHIHFYYLIAIVLCSNLLSVVEYLLSKGEVLHSDVFQRSLWMISDVIVYPCIGYFIHNKLNVKDIHKKIPLLWLVNFIGIAVSCFMTYYVGKIDGDINELTTEKFFNSFVLLNCFTIFATVKYIFETIEVSDRVTKIILSVGKTTFGIYLLHQIVKTYLSHYSIVPEITKYGVDSMVAVLLYCLGIFLVCYMITFAFLKIPILRSLFKG